MPGADQPASVTSPTGPRIAVGPAEPLGTCPQTLHEHPARPRRALLRVRGGLVADPQLDRVDPGRDRELVHRRLQRERARALPRRAHP